MHPTVTSISFFYPEGPLADAVEDQIQQSLPPVAGLNEAISQEERLAAYAAAIKSQREEFVEVYGDPYAWERRQESRATEKFTLPMFRRSSTSADVS